MNTNKIEDIVYVDGVEVNKTNAGYGVTINLGDKRIERDAIDATGEGLEKGGEEHKERAEEYGNEVATIAAMKAMEMLKQTNPPEETTVQIKTFHELDM